MQIKFGIKKKTIHVSGNGLLLVESIEVGLSSISGPDRSIEPTSSFQTARCRIRVS